jgi:hypothetical protein
MGLRGPNAQPVRNSEDQPKRKRAAWRKSGLSRAGRVIAFSEGLKITSGVHPGRKFKLRPWQLASEHLPPASFPETTTRASKTQRPAAPKLSVAMRKAHGLSPVFVICDEVAQWRVSFTRTSSPGAARTPSLCWS